MLSIRRSHAAHSGPHTGKEYCRHTRLFPQRSQVRRLPSSHIPSNEPQATAPPEWPVLPALASLCREVRILHRWFSAQLEGLQLWGKEAQLPGETKIPDTFMDNPILILISHLEAHGGQFRVPAPRWEQGSHEQLPQFPCALVPPHQLRVTGSWITKLSCISTNGRCLDELQL